MLSSVNETINFTSLQVLQREKPKKFVSLKVQSELLPITGCRPIARTRETWADSVSISGICYLQSHSCTSLVTNTGLQRFILQHWHVQTSKLGPEPYLRPLGLKHVSAKMALDLASGDF